MKKKLHVDAGFPQRVEVTYPNGTTDVFDDIIDFSVQEIGTDRKECTVDLRIKMATFQNNRGINLFKWIIASISSVISRWQMEE